MGFFQIFRSNGQNKLEQFLHMKATKAVFVSALTATRPAELFEKLRKCFFIFKPNLGLPLTKFKSFLASVSHNVYSLGH